MRASDQILEHLAPKREDRYHRTAVWDEMQLGDVSTDQLQHYLACRRVMEEHLDEESVFDELCRLSQQADDETSDVFNRIHLRGQDRLARIALVGCAKTAGPNTRSPTPSARWRRPHEIVSGPRRFRPRRGRQKSSWPISGSLRSIGRRSGRTNRRLRTGCSSRSSPRASDLHLLDSQARQELACVDIVAAAATGRSVLGQLARDPIRILYIDLEMTEADLRERLTDLGYGPDDDLSNLAYYQLPQSLRWTRPKVERFWPALPNDTALSSWSSTRWHAAVSEARRTAPTLTATSTGTRDSG